MQKQNAQALDKHIGKRLRALRQERGMSLEQMGEILEVTQQQMSRYELGIHRLGAAQLYRASRGLNTPVSWFFYGYQENSDELQRLKTALREDRDSYGAETPIEKEQALVQAWRALPGKLQRERVLAMLEAFGFSV